jgi:hypothetical protein
MRQDVHQPLSTSALTAPTAMLLARKRRREKVLWGVVHFSGLLRGHFKH